MEYEWIASRPMDAYGYVAVASRKRGTYAEPDSVRCVSRRRWESTEWNTSIAMNI